MFKKLLISTRFGNLLIMGFGQWLAFRTFAGVDPLVVWEVILGTCAVAFGGYIINDFYDQKIDEINRPGRSLFIRPFFKKYGLLVYALANVLGLGLGALVGPYILILNLVCTVFLFIYSAFFKRVAVVGNLLVAIMQALVFVPVLLVEDAQAMSIISDWPTAISSFKPLFLIGILSFAFLTGWIREWAKDMEDENGDGEQGAKTAAIIWSYSLNKKLLGLLCAALVLGVAGATACLYNAELAGELASGVLGYYFLFLLLPLSIRAFIKVLKAKEQSDWTKLSQWMKMIMLAGILAMGVA